MLLIMPDCCTGKNATDITSSWFVTFRLRHGQGKMYNWPWLSVCLCVCLSLATFPHYCTDPDVTWGNGGGMLSSCALLDGFAIGARVSLL